MGFTKKHIEKIYKFGAIKCGIKYRDRYDFALVKCDMPCKASVMITKNKFAAPSCIISKSNSENKISGLIVNTGVANAATGETGYNNARELNDGIANKLNMASNSILQCSTGVIGIQLPLEKMISSSDELIKSVDYKNAELFSKAILTTDTVNKIISYDFKIDNKTYKITGTIKGSGMIAPNMATMLCFLFTDFSIEKEKMDEILKITCDKTLNSVTVDGDTSTNDTVILLSPDLEQFISDKNSLLIFEDALLKVLSELSRLLILDAEGATKCVTIKVKNAKTLEQAKRCAKTIAESVLVKTAIFGKDPNWGRIACAAGYSGADFDIDKISICFDNVYILKDGKPDQENLQKVNKILEKKEFIININLEAGGHCWEYLTSDLSYEYVKINAEYTT